MPKKEGKHSRKEKEKERGREKGKERGKEKGREKEPAANADVDPLAQPVAADVKAKQQQELLAVTKNMCTNAIAIYEAKLHAKHERMCVLEEEIRSLNWRLDMLEKGGDMGCATPPQGEAPDVIQLRQPIDLDAIDTVKGAKKAYSKLLLYYLEHQTVLDTIIGHKQQQVVQAIAQLKEKGWQPSVETAPSASPSKRAKKKAKAGKLPIFGSKHRKESSGSAAQAPQAQVAERTVELTSRERTAEETVRLVSNKGVLSQRTGQQGAMVTPDNFTVLRVIGEGAFGKVYLVTKKKTGERMAMKVMKKQSILEDGDDSLRHVIHELEFMRDMSHHPFIVSLYHSFQTASDVSIVMEWVGGGSVFELLVNREDPFNTEEARFFSAQVLLAVQALHSNDIVYRDLKLENILLDEDGYIRLSDFGLSSRAKHGDRIHSFSGTATYLAPEIIEDTGEKGHDRSVDMWCFGVMLFIMLTQEPPFYAEHYPDLFNLIRSTEIPFNFYSYLSPVAVDLLKGLLTKDPKKRLGCGPRGLQDVMDHAFFSGISWKNLLAKKTKSPMKPNIYYGKPLTEDEQEEKELMERGASGGDTSAPIDVFKGFSFVWDPKHAQEVMQEAIEVVSQGQARGGLYKRKNHIVMNFFVWIKEVQGLSAAEDGKAMFVRWKHECRKQLTSVGPDANVVQDQTEAVVAANRSLAFEGGMHNACIPFDYLMVQDRKTGTMEARPLLLTLHVAAGKQKKGKEKPVASLTLDMADYGLHKLAETQILTMDGGPTATISLVCTWKSYNGDPVDNYEKTGLRKAKPE